MDPFINTQMIILAREARGMNQHELAEKIRMSPTNLSKIERGEIGVSEALLETISEITAYPPHFFTKKGSIVPGNLSYRKRQVVAQKLLTPINARINIIKQHLEFLATALCLPVPGIFTQTETAHHAAQKLRKKLQLPPGPVEDLTARLEQLGMPVMHLDFGTSRVDSRSILTDQKHPIIFLNKEHTGDRMRFSLAYELGHLVMHTFSTVSVHRDIAHEANEFAAELLMPARDIRSDLKNGVTIPLLAELKQKWKVSMIALLYRADDLELITCNQKRYLLQQFNHLQIRRREPPELDIAIEQPRLLKKWVAGYQKKHRLSITEMSALLCLHPEEFIELYS